MKRIICEDMFGNELFSFDFKEDVQIQNYYNCEIADIDKKDDLTIIRLQEIENPDNLPF